MNRWILDKEIDFDSQYYTCGYHYENENEEEYVEFHVDTNEFVHQEASRRYKFGGTTSIRVKNEEFCPILIFGQDESAFHQFLLKSKNWTGPKGECALLPKSEEMAVMVSAIVSRDTGFGLQLDSTQLAEINSSRQGRKYTDAAAAMDVDRCWRGCFPNHSRYRYQHQRCHRGVVFRTIPVIVINTIVISGVHVHGHGIGNTR
jgi:hypothetical protein